MLKMVRLISVAVGKHPNTSARRRIDVSLQGGVGKSAAGQPQQQLPENPELGDVVGEIPVASPKAAA